MRSGVGRSPPTVLLLLTASLPIEAATLRGGVDVQQQRALHTPLAYASVGKSGDFGRQSMTANGGDMDAQTWTFAGGGGWIYGLGACIGPFFGVGVGYTIPGGILAGAGGGVGIVFGIGFGSGFVWGGGRGMVEGFGVVPPMTPPFYKDGPPRDLPSLQQLMQGVGDEAAMLRERVARIVSDRLAGNQG